MRFIAILGVLSLLFSSYTVVEDRSTLKVLTPSLLGRKTQKIRLDNGLQAYLISDPGTYQSGAALAVGTGSFDDPKEWPGMAHFVEHMLFMGTEKYPDEEDYHRFLNEHGGQCNAFTTDDRTVYIFACDNENFSGALDRFAQLFIAPLFRSSSLQREAIAIDQEFNKDLPLDTWRVLFVKKELSNPSHPFSQFSIGNKETLKDVTSDELRKWYEGHYSSDLMHLVIYGSEPIEEMEKQVVSLFSDVKKREVSKTSTCHPLFTSQNITVIKPLQDIKLLELSWELPVNFCNDKECHTDSLLSFVLGHEGEKSLFSELKKENLASGLSAEKDRIGREKSLFSLNIKLTNKGVENYQLVVDKCFHAIAEFSESGIPKYLFDEIKRMKRTDYSYQSREEPFDFVTELAYHLVDEPLETFPETTLIPSTYDPKKITDMLGCLTPQNCQITLVVDPALIDVKCTKKERWMGTEYTVIPPLAKKTADSLIKKCFALPAPNPFLPENLIVNEQVSKTGFPKPYALIENEKGVCFFAKDEQFLTPEITFIAHLKTAKIKANNTQSIILANLYTYALEKRLNELFYEAKLGGLKASLAATDNGIQCKIDGYSEKAYPFLGAIIEKIATFQPKQEEFMAACEFYGVDYKNRLNKTPLSLGLDVTWSLVYKDYPSLAQKEKILPSITFSEFDQFALRLFEEGYVEGLLYGNMKEEEAKAAFMVVQDKLIKKAYPKEHHFKKALAVLSAEKAPYYFAKKTKLPSNGLILMLDCGDATVAKKCALEVLTTGLKEPFFTELRTKQQTAYIVTNMSEEIENHLYSFFITQSTSHDTRDLMARFELFLESSLKNLSEKVIPKERFESIRASLLLSYEHPAENIKDMSEILFKIAFEKDKDFSMLEKKREALSKLTYEEFEKYAQEFLGKENMKRLAICINGNLPQKEILSYRKMPSLEKLKESISYKEKQ